MKLRIITSSKGSFCLRIDLISIKFQSWNRQDCPIGDISSESHELVILIILISDHGNIGHSWTCDAIYTLRSWNTNPVE